MLPSPSSSPQRPVLHNTTNFNPLEKRTEKQQQTLSFLPTPPKCRGVKRPVTIADAAQRKRLKFEDSDDGDDSDSSACGSDAPPSKALVRRRRPADTAAAAASRYQTRKHEAVSTRPILQSFVSSLKLDTYSCEYPTFVVPPIYASAYSHGAKRGNPSIFAVANERGSVHLIDTSRRDPWDPAPIPNILQPHNNGIFDLKWNASDTLIATASGDQTTRVTSVETGAILASLRAHTGTVKCTAWDPMNPNLLATGARDGAIFLWDLRDDESIVAMISGAHEDLKAPRKRLYHTRTVTSLLYSDVDPYNLISSGTADGVLRCWDVRLLLTKKRAPKPRPIAVTLNDPTCYHGSRRPRGIKSLCKGSGPTAGLLFGLSADSRVHVYSHTSLAGLETTYSQDDMQTNSFYVGLSASPCGRWLGCGGPRGNAFLFDISNAGRRGMTTEPKAVLVRRRQETKGEIGSVDWSSEGFATCSDEGLVKVWRPDLEAYKQCVANPEHERWHWDWAA